MAKAGPMPWFRRRESQELVKGKRKYSVVRTIKFGSTPATAADTYRPRIGRLSARATDLRASKTAAAPSLTFERRTKGQLK